jgi:TonB-dependent SusC/RagA subfamily outer membrane receptor
MKVKPDRDYSIELFGTDSIKYATCSFHVEEYELQKSVFKIECDDHEQVKGKPFEIKYIAKDENGLPMRDTKADVFLTAVSISNVSPNHLYIPDTIWSYQFPIEDGSKTIVVPDSLFADANYNYYIKTTLHNAENEKQEATFQINYLQKKFEIRELVTGDSIEFKAFQNDSVVQYKVNIRAVDRYGYYLSEDDVMLPYKTKINTHVASYRIKSEKLSRDIVMDNSTAQLECNASRTGDSVYVEVLNPRRLSFTYQIYQRNKEILRGSGKALNTAIEANEKDLYYVALQYIWAGKMVSNMYQIPLHDKLVTLTVDQPKVIYPGKETEITITATDYRNKPVKDMSILTYAYTAKFNQDPDQTLPDFSSKQKAKYALNNFSEESNFRSGKAINLNYPFWKHHMTLDTIPDFRFIFPENKIEKIEIPAKNKVTQIAPFVTDSGRLQGVHYVLINYVPAYFGFTQHGLPYSFEVNNGYNQVMIRTRNSLIIIDSFRAEAGCKTMFTVDLHRYMKHVTVTPMPDTLTTEEINNFSNYIIRINSDNTTADKYCYLGGLYSKGVARLYSNYNRRYYDQRSVNTFGPITNYNNWSYHVPGSYSIDFEVAPGFAYTFRPQHVKMIGSPQREVMIDPKVACEIPALDDWIITAAEMEALHNQQPALRRRNINYALNYNGDADLQIELAKLGKDSLGNVIEPLNIILTQPGNFNFFNIYPGTTRYFDRLPEGKYTMLIVEENGVYRNVDNIELKPNGINFYRIEATDTLSKTKINKLDSFINALYYLSNIDMKRAAPVLMGKFTEATYNGPVEIFRGTIHDTKGEGIPGATIKIKGTEIGTMTDIDGYFEISVPIKLLRGLTFVLSGIAYESGEFPAEQNKKYILVENTSELSEVAVYGSAIDKRSYVGSVSTVTAADIHKRPVTNVLTALSGSAPGVQVGSGGGQPGASPDVMLRGFGSLSAGSAPLVVIDGAVYTGSLSSIDPSLVGNMSILKDASATGLYGARGANGVILITTKEGATLPDYIKKALEETVPIIPEDIMVGGLRNHFRDDAFWQPNLVTDKDGKVSFKVKFPDDLTSWNTYVYATDDEMHVGQTSGNIKSFKPVSASLQATTFLVEGDSANFIGKSVNYISDTIAITNSYFINDSLQKETAVNLIKYNNEIIPITAGKGDSIKLKYLLSKADGYFDGEEKTLDILPRGVSVAKGEFLYLDGKDTTITIPPVNNKEPLYLSATASLIDIVVDEIEKVKNYKHLCNEQLSSKIIATLTQQKIYEALKKPLPKNHKQDVQKMVNLLLQRQNNSQLWGWWGDGQSVIWISQHVLKALNFARDMNYSIGQLNFDRIVQPMVHRWESDTNYVDLQSLKLLQTAGMKIDYAKYISRLERKSYLSLGQKLELLRLRQELKLPYRTKILMDLKQEDIYGNIFWKDTAQYIYDNEVTTTLTAFKILQADSSIHINKQMVIGWFTHERKVDGWRNIYESSQLIEAIASSIDLSDTNALKPVLTFSGGLDEKVETYPFTKKINTNETITLKKSGVTPVYFSWYQRQWDTTDNNLGKDFIVSSAFEQYSKKVNTLKGGEAVQLKVTVKVIKSAEFVMIEIPVPAGCSYQSKSRGYNGNEVHREYYKDRVSIFCEKLPKGEYIYTIDLLPRYTGKYTLNPAKAELMYFPVFYGREKMKKVAIE